MIKPIISVIILSFNTKKVTVECLERLRDSIAFLKEPVEVIVVENGTDGTGDLIKKKFPWVRVLEPHKNLGYSRGNNFGMRSSSKDSSFFLLLNSDAFVEKETLKKSVEFMRKHKDCGVLGCRLRLEDGSIQSSGGFLPTPLSVCTWIYGIDLVPGLNYFLKAVHPKNSSFFSRARKVGWVMGAYFFLRREVLDKVGGMDENFFMYMEEVEWCKRISDAGFNIYYTPDFEVIHLDKASSKSNSDLIKRIFVNEIGGILYFMNKYYKRQVWWISNMIKLGLVIRVLIFSFIGNKIRASAYKEALSIIK
jgi:hypothetical protein